MRTEKELVLSAEELYYLGFLLNAEFIDYAYVRILKDIGDKADVIQSEARNSLEEKNVLSEDFSGDLEVDEEIAGMLKPVFFGHEEAAVDICYMKEGVECNNSSTRFHFMDETITQIDIKKDGLYIKAIDEKQLKDFVKELEPAQNVSEDVELKERELDKKKINRIIGVKNISLGKFQSVNAYVECDGIMYCENVDQSSIQAIGKDDFNHKVFSALREV